MNSNIEQNLQAFATAFDHFSLCKAKQEKSLRLVESFTWFCDQLGLLDYRFHNVPIRVICKELRSNVTMLTDPCEELEAVKEIIQALYYERFTAFTKPYYQYSIIMRIKELIYETLDNIQGLVSFADYLIDTPYILRDIKKIFKTLEIEDYHYNNGTYISPYSLHEHYVKSYRDYRKLRRTIAPIEFQFVKDDLNYFATLLTAIAEEDWDCFVKPYEPKEDITKIQIDE